jgi:hypothetical protein
MQALEASESKLYSLLPSIAQGETMPSPSDPIVQGILVPSDLLSTSMFPPYIWKPGVRGPNVSKTAKTVKITVHNIASEIRTLEIKIKK